MSQPTLHFYEAFWDLQPEKCPCDVQFVEWLDASSIVNSVIFHFGTGGHHYVGIENADSSRRNSVLGITAGPEEHEAYVQFVIRHPDVAGYYSCMFGDVYLLNRRLLPVFDAVTLFHLCEYRSNKNEAYGGFTDLQVAEILVNRTRLGGHVLFYRRSLGFDLKGETCAKDVIADLEENRLIEHIAAFKDLLVFRKTTPPKGAA